MIRRSVLRFVSGLALVSAVACDKAAPSGPDSSTSTFSGQWVGVKRLVSCLPAGPRCQLQSLGEETYFAATLDQQGDTVDGSAILSEPGPLALPYGFAIKGQVSSPAQLTFDRIFFFDVGEPPYSGEVSIRKSLVHQLIGRLTKHASASDDLVLVWEIQAVRR